MCYIDLPFHTNLHEHYFDFLPHQQLALTKIPFTVIQPNLSTNKKHHESDKSLVAYSTTHVI